MTLSANRVVQVNPSVLNAGGNGLALNGLMLTQSARVPVNNILNFSSAASVIAYFGATAPEAQLATVYFNGFTGATQAPGALLFAQFTAAAVAAQVRGGNVAGLTLPQLQAINGSLAVIIDGFSRSGTVNLSGASSFSAAAALIAAALNAVLPQEASFTGSIAPVSASFTGSIAGNVLNVTALSSGTLAPGAVITTTVGSGVLVNTVIDNQLTGVTGSLGTYAVGPVAQAVSGTTMTASYGLMTVTSVAAGSGTISVGQTLTGSGVVTGTAGTTLVTGLGTGTGLTGTYYVSPSQTAGSEVITATATALAVAYDSQSGGFIITSGVIGSASTAAFATGAAAASLGLTAQSGAVLSQGANGQTPAAFMANLLTLTQNWATFFLNWDPDLGNGNAQKLLFAQWVGGTNNRYCFVCTDTDTTPTNTLPASASLGQLIAAAAISGVYLIYQPSASLNVYGAIAAFASGIAAALNFQQTNGRFTWDFRAQSGLFADVTTDIVGNNLAGNPQVAGSFGNNYNFYGATATANSTFIYMERGTVSGPFQWMDSYIDQIWLSNAFQLAMVQLLLTVGQIPYNAAGNALIEAAVQSTIQQAGNFGVFRPGVQLSSLQVAEVNNQAGKNIATTLQARGWYLLVGVATPQVRQSRASPPITFWYVDGESVQAITLASIELQ